MIYDFKQQNGARGISLKEDRVDRILEGAVGCSTTPQMFALCGVRDRTPKTSVRVFTRIYRFQLNIIR